MIQQVKTMKVRCKNCDAVIDVPEERMFVGFWIYFSRCYHCNSVETVKTDEPYRGPKWISKNADEFEVKSDADKQWDNNAFGSSRQ